MLTQTWQPFLLRYQPVCHGLNSIFINLFKIQNFHLCSKNGKPNTDAHKCSLECKRYFFLQMQLKANFLLTLLQSIWKKYLYHDNTILIVLISPPMIYHMIGSLLHTMDTRLFGNWILLDTQLNQKYVNPNKPQGHVLSPI